MAKRPKGCLTVKEFALRVEVDPQTVMRWIWGAHIKRAAKQGKQWWIHDSEVEKREVVKI